MYDSKFVVALKVGGKVLRENGDAVTLPFGSEYSLLVKNMHSVRAQFTVSVDGQDATENVKLIMGPNSEVELERFIKGGNINAGNRFKFIERTAEVEAHRGVGAEDGLIRVELWRERILPSALRHPFIGTRFRQSSGPGGSSMRGQPRASSGLTGQSVNSGGTLRSASMRSFSDVSGWDAPVETQVSTSGITVPGSISEQKFTLAATFPLEYPSTVIVMRLLGEVAGQPVVTPVTVAHKPVCTTCGQTGKAKNNFCSRCGTSLEVVA